MKEEKLYRVSDGNACENHETWDDVIGEVVAWYDWMGEDERYAGIALPVIGDVSTIGAGDIDALNAAIADWEENIAEACGHEPFHGHGTYSVNSASQMGLNLSVELESD